MTLAGRANDKSPLFVNGGARQSMRSLYALAVLVLTVLIGSTSCESLLTLPTVCLLFSSVSEVKKNDTTANSSDLIDAPASKNRHQLSTRYIQRNHKIIVTFVNGIYHSEAEWRELSGIIKKLFDNEVRPFYNPSSGWWVKDALGAGYELVRRPNDLITARKLAEHLREALKEVGPDGRVLHLAHSGGAILTYLAAKYHLTKSETDRIDVATFGGGRSITRKYFKGRIVNYYARNDPLVLLDGRAGKLFKKLSDDEKKTQNGDIYDNYNINKVNGTATANNKDANNDMIPAVAEVRDKKHNTSFVFLRGVLNNPIFDHSMFGPTYKSALQLEAENFLQRLKDIRSEEIARAGLVRKIRKTASQYTGIHHFWGNALVDAELTMRSVRKRAATMTGLSGFFSGKGREKERKKRVMAPNFKVTKNGLFGAVNVSIEEESSMKPTETALTITTPLIVPKEDQSSLSPAAVSTNNSINDPKLSTYKGTGSTISKNNTHVQSSQVREDDIYNSENSVGTVRSAFTAFQRWAANTFQDFVTTTSSEAKRDVSISKEVNDEDIMLGSGSDDLLDENNPYVSDTDGIRINFDNAGEDAQVETAAKMEMGSDTVEDNAYSDDGQTMASMQSTTRTDMSTDVSSFETETTSLDSQPDQGN